MLRSCTIVTSAATGPVARIHDRMPVVLPREAWADWLSPGPLAPGELAELLAPAPAGLLVGYPVSQQVNDARIEGPELVEAVDLAEPPEEPAPPANERSAEAQTLFELPAP
jgi:putative SOS response-associated peptidase YedK